jgi:hypothetical protein
MIILPNYRGILGGIKVTQDFYRDFVNINYDNFTTALNPVTAAGIFSVNNVGQIGVSTYFDLNGIMRTVTPSLSNTPRFTTIYNSNLDTMVPNGLLIEVGRTNSIFNRAVVNNGNNLTVTLNQADLTLDGTKATLLVGKGAAQNITYYNYNTLTPTASGNYTGSIYVSQYLNTPYAGIYLTDSSGNGIYSFLDFNTGTIVNTNTTGSPISAMPTTYTEIIKNINFAKKWYRITATARLSSSAPPYQPLQLRVFPAVSTNINAPNAVTSSHGIYTFAPQLELNQLAGGGTSNGWWTATTYISSNSTSAAQRGRDVTSVINGRGVNFTNPQHTLYLKMFNPYVTWASWPGQNPWLTLGVYDPSTYGVASNGYIQATPNSLNPSPPGFTIPTIPLNANTYYTVGWSFGTFTDGTSATNYSIYDLTRNTMLFSKGAASFLPNTGSYSYGSNYPTCMSIGTQGGGSGQINGVVQSIYHYGRIDDLATIQQTLPTL